MTYIAGHEHIVSRMSYPSAAAPRAPLVTLRDAHEEIRAGFGGAEARVRTLDGVSIAVHAGELVLVQGGVASGAASLVSAIVGWRRLGRGVRHASRGLQIRRGQIDEMALHSLQSGWTHGGPRTTARDAETHVLYVLRVRRSTIGAGAPTHAIDQRWRAWAAQLRQRGGSVLVHVTTALPTSRISASSSPLRVVSEASPVDHERRDDTASVRVLTLVAGRIVSADPTTRPWWPA